MFYCYLSHDRGLRVFSVEHFNKHGSHALYHIIVFMSLSLLGLYGGYLVPMSNDFVLSMYDLRCEKASNEKIP